jgi:pilus assembly protein CpaB
MAATWTARQTASPSNRRALLLSLVLGLLAAFLLFRLVTAAQPKSAAPVTVPVLVAKQDIPARTVVTAGMVAVKQVPASLRLASAFTDSQVAIGQAVRSPISAGEQVLTSQITSNTVELGFSGQVPAGMRAVSINVQEVVNSGNLVQPGDSVDVIGVFQVVGKTVDDGTVLVKDGTGQPKRLTSVTLAQDVKVLAVAQSFDDTPSQTPRTASKTGQADIKTVTLAVTPEDAQKIFLADEDGTIRLALHRFDDHDTPPITPIDNSVAGVTGSSTSNGFGAQPLYPKPGSPQR